MADPNFEDAEEKPLDPAVALVEKRLRRLMLIAGLTLGLGILAVFLAILYRIATMDDKMPVAAGEESPPSDGMPAVSSLPAPPQSRPPGGPTQLGEGTPDGTGQAMRAVEASIPADARLVASTVAGGRIVLTYEHFAGTLVLLVDPETLEVVGRLDLKPE